MKQKLLQIIETKLSELNEHDAEGFIWWMKFRTLIENFPEQSNELPPERVTVPSLCLRKIR